MAECVPSDTPVLASCLPAFVMQGQTTARSEQSHPAAPDTHLCIAPAARNQTATGGTDIVLLGRSHVTDAL